MRTTLNLDGPVLEELKALQAKERKSLGRLVSDLLLVSLAQREQQESRTAGKVKATWISTHPAIFPPPCRRTKPFQTSPPSSIPWNLLEGEREILDEAESW